MQQKQKQKLEWQQLAVRMKQHAPLKRTNAISSGA
ncbi:hypothetical protein SAMN04488602_10368 [Paenibacillus sp. cl123]|nr:hypothetical protein SAMN04488602_10368 [Paenibacillus sp. cl123]